jgi:hypothetical protein
MPQGSDRDTAPRRVSSFGWDVKRGSGLPVVTKDPMTLIGKVGVLTQVSWLNSQSGPHTIMATIPASNWLIHPLFPPVTIPQVMAVKENMFLVNLPGKIRIN